MSSEKQNAQLLRLKQSLTDNAATLPKDLADFFKFLPESEAQAKVLITCVNDPTRTPPYVPPQGDIEVGFVLYWIHYPPPKFSEWMNEKGLLQDIVCVLVDDLQKEALPTKITTHEYNNLIAKIDKYGVPWDDGTIFGFEKYQQLKKLKGPGSIFSERI